MMRSAKTLETLALALKPGSHIAGTCLTGS